MIQNTDTQLLLYRARLFLGEGRNEAALSMLQTIHPENEKLRNDVAYLLGWCYIQRKQWEDAFRVLSPLLPAAQRDDGEQEALVERELLVLHLLRLGQVALHLAHREDASQHFTLCLKVLRDRRVHLPGVRIKVRYYLALTCCLRGLISACVEHYEEALNLCRHYGREEEVPDILYRLCDAYWQKREYVKAYMRGQEALSRYQDRMDRQMEARMYNLLGRTCHLLGNYNEATDHFTESLALAVNFQQATLAMSNCAGLAEVHMVQERLSDAKRYCQHALEHVEHSDNLHMRGVTYQVIGKVTYAEARRTEGRQRAGLLDDAVLCFEKALTELRVTQAYPDIAEVYANLATVLEDLGRMHEAIECWRNACKVMSHTATWYHICYASGLRRTNMIPSQRTHRAKSRMAGEARAA